MKTKVRIRTVFLFLIDWHTLTILFFWIMIFELGIVCCWTIPVRSRLQMIRLIPIEIPYFCLHYKFSCVVWFPKQRIVTSSMLIIRFYLYENMFYIRILTSMSCMKLTISSYTWYRTLESKIIFRMWLFWFLFNSSFKIFIILSSNIQIIRFNKLILLGHYYVLFFHIFWQKTSLVDWLFLHIRLYDV